MLKFARIRDVKAPSRGTPGSACFDFYVPLDLTVQKMRQKNQGGVSYIIKTGSGPMDYTEVNVGQALIPRDLADARIAAMKVAPHDRVLIPSGIHVRLPEGTALIAFNKSGIANNKGLIAGACVVDVDYQGEVHLSFINTTKDPIIIEAGLKLLQAAIVPVIMCQTEEFKDVETLYAGMESERGAGGFGSTGVK